MTTPALRALKGSRPGRRITLLTSPSGAAVAPMIPEVDDCWAYDAPWMKATAGRVGPGRRPLHDRPPPRRGVRRRRHLHRLYPEPAPGGDGMLPGRHPAPVGPLPREFLSTPDRQDRRARAGRVHTPRGPEATRPRRRRGGNDGSTSGSRSACPRGPDRGSPRSSNVLEVDDGRPWAVVHPGSTAPSRRYAPIGIRRGGRGPGAVSPRTSGSSSPATRGSVPWSNRSAEAMGEPSESLAGGLRPGRPGGPPGAGAGADLEQHRPCPRRGGGGDAGGRPLRPDEPAAHPLGRTEPGPQPPGPLLLSVTRAPAPKGIMTASAWSPRPRSSVPRSIWSPRGRPARLATPAAMPSR